MSSPVVSVIIPALNEENRLSKTLAASIEFLKKQSYSSEIIVVTDGSTDRTKEVAESFISSFPDLRVMDFPVNYGKGFGVKNGMLAAKGQFRMYMDADNAVPIDFLPSFLDKCRAGYDVVIGSRREKDSKILRSQKLLRQQLARGFGLLQKIVLRFPYRDTTCGFKLFTAEATETLFSRLTLNCALFDTELLYIAHKLKMKVFIHGVTWRHDPETRIPVGFRRSIQLALLLFAIRKIHK